MSILRMNALQYRRMRKLVHRCCNYCGGNCLLLDDGEACICVQEISHSLLCGGTEKMFCRWMQNCMRRLKLQPGCRKHCSEVLDLKLRSLGERDFFLE